jgi:hypothetical protein
LITYLDDLPGFGNLLVPAVIMAICIGEATEKLVFSLICCPENKMSFARKQNKLARIQ